MVQFKTHILKAAIDLFQWRRKVGGGGKLAKLQIHAHAPDVALAQCKVSEEDVPLRIWRIFVVVSDAIWCTIFHIFYILQHVSIGVSLTIYLQSNTFYADIESKVEGPCPCPPPPCTSRGTVPKGITIFYCTVFPTFIGKRVTFSRNE